MKIGIVANANKIKDPSILSNLLLLLEKNGYSCVVFQTYEQISEVDALIVLGGDGAILHSAVFAAQRNIPIIGINYGNLGFLAEFEREETSRVIELLDKFKAGSCHVLNRSVLQISVGEKTYYALNEVCLQRDCATQSSSGGQILKAKIEIGNERNEIAGDGLLICTPTGSTAYSLSAGGAILFPDAPVFMMTQLCALSLHSRPVVFSDTEETLVTIQQGVCLLVVDGRTIDVLLESDSITVKKAPFNAEFPMNQKAVFLKKIKNKLNK